jgi:hypothetical protein
VDGIRAPYISHVYDQDRFYKFGNVPLTTTQQRDIITLQAMQPMQTLPQPLARNLQVAVTEDAYRRLKVQAAKDDSSMGRVISELAETHLLPVADAA